jgi:serine/threonine-protein phosphatase 2A regulatory subunit B'
MITDNKQVVFPIIMRGLLKNSKSHWNQSVQTITLNVMKSLMEIDSALFEQLSEKIQKEETNMEKQEQAAKSQWDMLAKEFN